MKKKRGEKGEGNFSPRPFPYFEFIAQFIKSLFFGKVSFKFKIICFINSLPSGLLKEERVVGAGKEGQGLFKEL